MIVCVSPDNCVFPVGLLTAMPLLLTLTGEPKSTPSIRNCTVPLVTEAIAGPLAVTAAVKVTDSPEHRRIEGSGGHGGRGVRGVDGLQEIRRCGRGEVGVATVTTVTVRRHR